MTTGDEIAQRRAKLAEERDQLATAQQALLEKRLRRKPTPVTSKNAIPRRLESGPAPLSFSQQRLWFLDQVDPGNPAYNNALAVRLTGQLNVAAVEWSLNKIIQRHEV